MSQARHERHLLRFDAPFALESGETLPAVEVAAETWGRLAPDGGNALLVCHALTGTASAAEWWAGLFGPGNAFDPDDDYVVCTNVLGGCAGTTGPASERPAAVGGGRYGAAFPAITIRDMVRLQARALEQLGVRRLRLVVGGSMGGMQALEWPLVFPERVAAAVAVATSARQSAWCIGWSAAQRAARAADPAWRGGAYLPEAPPRAGLAAARAVAMCTYRSWPSFEERFGRVTASDEACASGPKKAYTVESYLRRQGEKLVDRFDANSYVTLTRAMDSHDVGRDRGGVEAALASVHQPTLVVGIASDVLYPLAEQEALARLLPAGRLVGLDSRHGHDGFLIDVAPLAALIADFRRSIDPIVAAPRAA